MFKNVTTAVDWYVNDLTERSWTIWVLPNLQIEKYRLSFNKGLTVNLSWLIFSVEVDVNWGE